MSNTHQKELFCSPSPLSVLTENLVTIPIRDMESWVTRSVDARHRETAKRRGYVHRPLNAFILYRLAYAERTKIWCREYRQQAVSKILGCSWRTEPSEIRHLYMNLAKVEKLNHMAAYPFYKYMPRRQRRYQAFEQRQTQMITSNKTFSLSTSVKDIAVLATSGSSTCEYWPGSYDVAMEATSSMLDLDTLSWLWSPAAHYSDIMSSQANWISEQCMMTSETKSMSYPKDGARSDLIPLEPYGMNNLQTGVDGPGTPREWLEPEFLISKHIEPDNESMTVNQLTASH